MKMRSKIFFTFTLLYNCKVCHARNLRQTKSDEPRSKNALSVEKKETTDNTSEEKEKIEEKNEQIAKTKEINFKKRSMTGDSFWEDYGGNLDGESAHGEFGLSVSNSYDGKVMAVSGNKIAVVFEFINGDWEMSTDLSNVMDTGRGFFSVTLSNDGMTVALGAPNNDKQGNNSGEVVVYGQQISGAWEQKGSNINGIEDDLFGKSISLSADGNILAVGAYGAGHMKVYDFRDTTKSWSLSNLIPGKASEGFGFSVSISGNGKCAIIGAPFYENSKGYIRMYDILSFSFIQAEFGVFEDDHFGYSVSMSLDGTRAAAGAWGGYYARVYYLSGFEWFQLGINIQGLFNAFGASISISDDGSLVAVGAPWAAEYGSQSGCAKIYELQGNTYNQIGTNINGERVNDLCGSQISLSSNGSRLAIGCPGKDSGGYNSGQVQIYKIPGYFSDDDVVGDGGGENDEEDDEIVGDGDEGDDEGDGDGGDDDGENGDGDGDGEDGDGGDNDGGDSDGDDTGDGGTGDDGGDGGDGDSHGGDGDGGDGSDGNDGEGNGDGNDDLNEEDDEGNNGDDVDSSDDGGTDGNDGVNNGDYYGDDGSSDGDENNQIFDDLDGDGESDEENIDDEQGHSLLSLFITATTAGVFAVAGSAVSAAIVAVLVLFPFI